MASSETTGSSRYDEFVADVERVYNLEHAQRILRWDQQVTMPEAGTTARSGQLSALSAATHDRLAGEEMADHLAALEDAALDDEQSAVVREVRRRHERKAQVPRDLVERISAATSESFPVWQEAKADADFSTFEPALGELVELKRDYAAAIDPDADPYAVLFADYEPYLDLETAESVLADLREGLVPLIEAIAESDVEPPTVFSGTYETETQAALAEDLLDGLGYDRTRGRLDTAAHPFSSGSQFDARVTTRYDEADPLGALLSTVHEFGHATYTLGLPDEHYGTPLGEARDLTVHESQSRLWENHVGRSRPFWEWARPVVADRFPVVGEASAEDCYRAVNRVYDDNPIRVEADELTYHLHIVLRFEIERNLIAGDLDVADVPAVWNEKMESYLGFRPEDDARGCLQDIHWSKGSFGYFPTYSLGSLLAAQLYDAMTDDLGDLDEELAAGEFDRVHDWLTEHVHRHGQRYTTDELVERATGEPLSAEPFLDYVEAKYGELYDL